MKTIFEPISRTEQRVYALVEWIKNNPNHHLLHCAESNKEYYIRAIVKAEENKSTLVEIQIKK